MPILPVAFTLVGCHPDRDGRPYRPARHAGCTLRHRRAGLHVGVPGRDTVEHVRRPGAGGEPLRATGHRALRRRHRRDDSAAQRARRPGAVALRRADAAVAETDRPDAGGATLSSGRVPSASPSTPAGSTCRRPWRASRKSWPRFAGGWAAGGWLRPASGGPAAAPRAAIAISSVAKLAVLPVLAAGLARLAGLDGLASPSSCCARRCRRRAAPTCWPARWAAMRR